MPIQRNINLLILCRVSTKHVVGLFPWLYKVFIYSFSKPVHRPIQEVAMPTADINYYSWCGVSKSLFLASIISLSSVSCS